MIKVKEYLDKYFHSKEKSTAEIKSNGHYSVHGSWIYPEVSEKYYNDMYQGYLDVNSIWCTCNNETIQIHVIANKKYIGIYGYLQTYAHIPRGDADNHGFYARSTDEEVIKYINMYFLPLLREDKLNTIIDESIH